MRYETGKVTELRRSIILRGCALLGIAVVNFKLFAHPVQKTFLPIDQTTSALNLVTEWLVRFLAEGKVYSLFCFLFGLGFTLQLASAAQSGIRFLPRYLRRMGILLAVTIFTIQAAPSRWWIRQYRLGPLEWLWRSLIYFSWQPIQRKAMARG